MGQFKVLERIRHQLHCYGRLGFWSDGDEVFDNLTQYGAQHKREYINDAIQKFERELNWLPDSIKESRLSAILETLAPFWNGAKEYFDDAGDGIGCEANFTSLVRSYYELATKYTAVSYYTYLAAEREELVDIYSQYHGLTPQLIGGTLADLSLCTAARFEKLEKKAKSQFDIAQELPNDEDSPSAKAQRTMRQDVEYDLDGLIEPVCDSLVKEKLATKNKENTTWKFKGTEEQYAYLGMKFQKAAQLTRIPWTILSENISFKGKISTIKRYASEMSKGKRDLPAGRIIIDSAFTDAIK